MLTPSDLVLIKLVYSEILLRVESRFAMLLIVIIGLKLEIQFYAEWK